KLDLQSAIELAQQMGAGELVINNIDRDGTMRGYEIEPCDFVWSQTSLPLIMLGGAGSHLDLSGLIARFQLIGAAAGSLFVFKGKLRAVLINYPSELELQQILGGLCKGEVRV